MSELDAGKNTKSRTGSTVTVKLCRRDVVGIYTGGHTAGTYIECHGLAVDVIAGQVLDVLVQVARPRARDRRAHDRGSAGTIVAEALVGSHQLAELLEPLEIKMRRGVLRGLEGVVGNSAK